MSAVPYFDGSYGMRGHMVKEDELRNAFHRIVQHAHAPQGSSDRMSKEDLMKHIDVLEKAWRDVGWTVYYP